MRADVVNATKIIQNQASDIRHLPWAALVGVLVLIIYLVPLPLIERAWRTTGDEPHYLLAAHSLVADRDFDLTNNYAHLDYLAFYFSRDITPHIRTNAAGQQILDHQLGLPIIIAPAYALGGRFGVLVFQAMLGSLLAVITFKLAVLTSHDEKASLLATLFVIASPPLLIYQYLVYPELPGALLTTLLIYYVVSQTKPTSGAAALVILSLMTLPWLNRRFAPLAILLALLILWAWRRDNTAKMGLSGIGIGGLMATGLSIAMLFWFNSQLDAPVRTDFTTPDGSLLWHRVTRGVGWLLDQQRGLFVYAPIYVVALWGLPVLLSDSFNHRRRNWFVMLPFLLSLGVTAAAGGFWVAWEVGPRFLVVALPALAPLLALAWRHYHCQKILTGLAMLLFFISLSNSLAIFQNPELPYKSSLPLYYGQKLGFPLTKLLPDLAGYARISAVEAGPTLTEADAEYPDSVWHTEAGRTAEVIQPASLPQLPFGHYNLTWPVRIEPGLPPATELMRISANFLGGGPLFSKVISAANLPVDGSYGEIHYSFLNTNVDRWRTPLVFHAVSTGRSNIWAKDILFEPDPFYAWFLPYFYLMLLVGAAFLTWYKFQPSFEVSDLQTGRLQTIPQPLMGGILLLLAIVTAGYLIYQKNQSGYTYDVNQLSHFVGRPISDAAAVDGQAWLVDPAIDPPQKAIYGPFDFYEPDRYQVTFRIKLPEPVETDQELARLQVNATANFDELVTQPVRLEHFSKPNLYHHFVLTIDNPRRQALSFEVHYAGVAPLVIDEVRIDRVGGG